MDRLSSALLLSLLAIAFVDCVFAQRTCGAPHIVNEEAERMIAERIEKASRGEIPRRGSINVDVQWIVISEDSGNSSVTDGQIATSIDQLNEAFNQTSLVFRTLCITRINCTALASCAATFGCDDDDLYGLSVDPEKALNIYLYAVDPNSPSTTLGYVNDIPSSDNIQPNDAVHARLDTMPGGTAAPYNLGDTVVHEVGHWAGLYHVFSDFESCGDEFGDQVADTPNQRYPTGGCPTQTRGTCDFDPFEAGFGGPNYMNFMDYTDDACMVEFTAGQAARVEQIVTQFRPMLGEPVSADQCNTDPLDIQQRCDGSSDAACRMLHNSMFF